MFSFRLSSKPIKLDGESFCRHFDSRFPLLLYLLEFLERAEAHMVSKFYSTENLTLPELYRACKFPLSLTKFHIFHYRRTLQIYYFWGITFFPIEYHNILYNISFQCLLTSVQKSIYFPYNRMMWLKKQPFWSRRHDYWSTPLLDDQDGEMFVDNGLNSFNFSIW